MISEGSGIKDELTSLRRGTDLGLKVLIKSQSQGSSALANKRVASMEIWGVGGSWGPGDDKIWILVREMRGWSRNACLLVGLSKLRYHTSCPSWVFCTVLEAACRLGGLLETGRRWRSWNSHWLLNRVWGGLGWAEVALVRWHRFPRKKEGFTWGWGVALWMWFWKKFHWSIVDLQGLIIFSIQQSDSHIYYIYIYPFSFRFFFPHRSSQNIG